ncbi:putative sulfate/molybdate transporter [Oceanidesulfovibrio marinus]|uniref:Sulfate permease n=1 Tax=Oceanidesulfovibrio marinus TaxID=370038 RepID=A0A6P1ZMW8_9BACT|nr:putative sulfate/molybdate transporter [Oceanidesulfovibrio marinus]QJT08947.1 sulfate permease [Oceanidesulfovibrio marinus]TVM36634.1 sulfate permease [Oceanidesulfovibrio marinus]
MPEHATPPPADNAPFSLTRYRFDRMELAGSLGDLGTLLPIAIGMLIVNGISSTGIFFSVGLFYILAGLYYRVPVAVQPMKVIGAYAIAQSLDASTVQAAGLLMAIILLVLGATRFMNVVARAITKPVIRGVQVSTGIILATKGATFILGTSPIQKAAEMAEPYLGVNTFLWLPAGIWIGLIFVALTLYLIDSRRFPAGIVVVSGGMMLGLLLSGGAPLAGVSLSLHLPKLLPFGFPGWEALSLAFLAMALPQTPMTIGNAVIANADLSREYFPEGDRVTPRALCISMAGANFLAFLVGGMPMCHGAGGLAAHYRFGARTAGSNLIIGSVFLILAVLVGPSVLKVVQLLPLSVLGVLLLFAGMQLCLQVMDIRDRRGMFTVLVMLCLTLASNLAVAFIMGFILSRLLQSERFSV